MNDARRSFREVPVGAAAPQAIIVEIMSDGGAGHKAAVWGDDRGGVEKSEFIDVAAALDAADAARTSHGFNEVVVMLQDGVRWQPGWGELRPLERGNEPVGDVSDTDLSHDETYELAAGIEAERDA